MMNGGGIKLQFLELLIGQIAARIVIMGVFIFIVLAVLEYWKNHSPIRHYPQRHICGDCGAAWTPDHQCFNYGAYRGPMYGEIWRAPSTEIQRRR